MCPGDGVGFGISHTRKQSYLSPSKAHLQNVLAVPKIKKIYYL